MLRFTLIGFLLGGSAMSAGCNTARCCINRLDNVCRNRCECTTENCQTDDFGALAFANAPVGLVEELPIVGVPKPASEELTKLNDQVLEAQKERDLAIREAASANGKLNELQSQLATVDDERNHSSRKLQAVTEQLVEAQRQLRDVEVGFTRMRADNDKVVGVLENRLAQLIESCDISSLEKPPATAEQ